MASLDPSQAYVVKLPNGRLVRCHVDDVGRERERRWIFQLEKSGDREAHIGPLFYPISNELELFDLVAEWCETKEALGEADVTLGTLRDRIVRELRKDDLIG